MKAINKMRWLYLHHVPVLPRLMHYWIRILYACDVEPQCDIASDVQFIHGGLGCVFHPNTVIRGGVKIYHNVTLGGNGKQMEKGEIHPVILENASIYAGACVLGPVTVGRNAIVGANAVVLQDVPDDCIAVGVPARIIMRE